jgi:hypothetical protein
VGYGAESKEENPPANQMSDRVGERDAMSGEEEITCETADCDREMTQTDSRERRGRNRDWSQHSASSY